MTKFHALLDVLHRIFSSRYVLYLESEVKRLRNENTLLLYQRANLPTPTGRPNQESAQLNSGKPAVVPKRRLSWFQENRAKEAGVSNEDRDFKAQENARVVAEATARAAKEAAEAMENFGS